VDNTLRFQAMSGCNQRASWRPSLSLDGSMMRGPLALAKTNLTQSRKGRNGENTL
jgi:hypothetical protein